MTVWLRFDGDVIQDAQLPGRGMRHLRGLRLADDGAVKGKTREEAERLFDRFHRLVTGTSADRRDGNPGQARRVLGCIGVSDAGEVRQPVAGTP